MCGDTKYLLLETTNTLRNFRIFTAKRWQTCNYNNIGQYRRTDISESLFEYCCCHFIINFEQFFVCYVTVTYLNKLLVIRTNPSSQPFRAQVSTKFLEQTSFNVSMFLTY